MKELTEDQANRLLMFLGDYWAQFVASCGDDEEEADQIYIALGGEE